MAKSKMEGRGYAGIPKILSDWGDKASAKFYEEKALAASDAVSGGFLVPPQFSQEIIEFLRPASVVRKLGPVIIPMPTGTFRIPKMTQGSTFTYQGENSNAGKTQPTFGNVTLTFKKLSGVVPISNDLMRYSSPGADAIVRDVDRRLIELEALYGRVSKMVDKKRVTELLTLMKGARQAGAGLMLAFEQDDYARVIAGEAAAFAILDAVREELRAIASPP